MLQMWDEPHIAQVAHRGARGYGIAPLTPGSSSSWRGWQLLQLQARKKLQQLQQAAILNPQDPLGPPKQGD